MQVFCWQLQKNYSLNFFEVVYSTILQINTIFEILTSLDPPF